MFITVLAFFLALFFFTSVTLGVILSRTKIELQRVNDLVKSKDIKLKTYQHKFNDAVRQHNRITDRWNNLPSVCRQGKCSTHRNYQLTLTDLKLLRFYIHPDKHQGKTTNLANKINQLFEERNNDTFN